MRALFRDAVVSFRMHDGPLMSGAVAFYALLALAPLGVIAVAVASMIVGQDSAQRELEEQISTFLGADTASYIADVVGRAGTLEGSWLATTLSVLFLIFASTRLFWMLRAALNHVWGVRSKIPPGFRGLGWKVLRRRLAAFVMVGVLALSLLATATLKAGLAIVEEYLGGVALMYRLLELGGSIAIHTVVVALVYRLLPDARIAWRDLLIGALGTAIPASIGSLIIGHYAARVSPASMYGAAGSLIVLLLWVYYTAQIFFFGAELTSAWAKHKGHGIEPLEHAQRVVMHETQEPLFEEPDLI